LLNSFQKFHVLAWSAGVNRRMIICRLIELCVSFGARKLFDFRGDFGDSRFFPYGAAGEI
jgi:hypothetical protein